MFFIHTPEELSKLISTAPEPSKCRCSLGICAGWESLSESRWPEANTELVATLRDPEIEEPTFEERHPDSTRYESPDAPIAVKFFPYNRCDLWHCNQCNRHLLRYTEFGGYYVDHRVRQLSVQATIID